LSDERAALLVGYSKALKEFGPKLALQIATIGTSLVLAAFSLVIAISVGPSAAPWDLCGEAVKVCSSVLSRIRRYMSL